MLDEKRIKEAEANVQQFLREGLLKKMRDETAKATYLDNSEVSLETAKKLVKLEDENYKPHLWILVTSYYAMYYMANVTLLELGYKVRDKISHKVTSEALIVYVRNKLKKRYIEDYEEIKDEALELISSQVDITIASFDQERKKRSKFQYHTSEKVKKAKALTSLKRAKSFIGAMKKMIPKKKNLFNEKKPTEDNETD